MFLRALRLARATVSLVAIPAFTADGRGPPRPSRATRGRWFGRKGLDRFILPLTIQDSRYTYAYAGVPRCFSPQPARSEFVHIRHALWSPDFRQASSRARPALP